MYCTSKLCFSISSKYQVLDHYTNICSVSFPYNHYKHACGIVYSIYHIYMYVFERVSDYYASLVDVNFVIDWTLEYIF